MNEEINSDGTMPENVSKLVNVEYKYKLTDEDKARYAEKMSDLDVEIKSIEGEISDSKKETKSLETNSEKLELERLEMSKKVKYGFEQRVESCTFVDSEDTKERIYYNLNGIEIKREPFNNLPPEPLPFVNNSGISENEQWFVFFSKYEKNGNPEFNNYVNVTQNRD